MNTTYDQVHFLVVVDLLHLLILACMRELFGIPLEITSSLFGVAYFLDQSLDFLQPSISNVPLDYHFDFSHTSLERSDLSPKNHP